MKQKLKWIIPIVIIALLAVIATILVIKEMKFQYSIEEIGEYRYFVFIQEGKNGVIDKAGNIIIEPEYVAVQIPNPSKPVFICVRSYRQEENDYDTVVYNEKKEVLFGEYQNVQAIPIETNIETNPYEKSVLMYKKEGKYGILSLTGKEITKPIYEKISSVNYKEGTFFVTEAGKMGVINMKGSVIIKNEYEAIIPDNYYNETTKNKGAGFIVSEKTQEGYRYGYIDYRGRKILKTEYGELERITQIPNEKEYYFVAFKNGQAGLLKNNKVILNYEYEDIQYYSANDIFIVQRNGKQGAMNKEGKVILPVEYNSILFGGIYLNATKDKEKMIFDQEGNKIETQLVSKVRTENPNYFIAVDKNDIYTVIDEQGNTILDEDYSYIEYLPGGFFIVARDGKNGIINSKGEFVVELKYTSIFRFNDTNVLQAEMQEESTIDLYNMQMQEIASMKDATIKQITNETNAQKSYILLASQTEASYYDENGKALEAKEIFPNNILYAKKTEGKWGFVDKSGNFVVQAQYDMVTEFNTNGFAGIKKDGKWGVINQSGTILQEPIYEISWTMPNFLGKYYQLNSWYGEDRYSSDKVQENS